MSALLPAGQDLNRAASLVLIGRRPVVLDEEFRHLMPPHSPAERAALERQLLADGACLEPLVVWQGCGILLDGYTRLEICQLHGLAFRTVEIAFAGRAEARAWVLSHQTGRRNLTAAGLSYLRGKRYLLEKHSHGGKRREGQSSVQTDHLPDGEASGQIAHLKTEERLAKEYRVSSSTIRRDAHFARAVDRIVQACGFDAKPVILAHEAGLSRRDTERLAEMGPADQRQVLEGLREGWLHRPWAEENGPATVRVPLELDALIAALLRHLGKERLREMYAKLAAALDESAAPE